MNDAMRITKIVARVFGAISLVSAFALLALGASCYNRAVQFKKTAVEAQGAVIEMRERSSSLHSGTVFFPVIRFSDKAGKEHTLYSNAGSYPPRYEVGDHVSVLYNPANPADAKISSFLHLWLWPLVLGIIGGMDLLTGLFLLFGLPLILRWAEKRTVSAVSP